MSIKSLKRLTSLKYCLPRLVGHHPHYVIGSSFSHSCPIQPQKILGGQFPWGLGAIMKRHYREDVIHGPEMKNPEILNAFKDLLAVDWDELPYSVVTEAKKALSKPTDDDASKDILANALRAALAVEEFGGKIMSLKMELDDVIGGSGEDVKQLPEEYVYALRAFFQRYSCYLESFGPHETLLRKKVETELGSKMIYLKMRCGGLGAEWGKVTVLGTSGLAGSFIEQRA